MASAFAPSLHDATTGGVDPSAARPTQIRVLDTSTLLSSPAAMLSFPATDVVVTSTVLRELDGLKSHPEVGFAARDVLRLLDSHLLDRDLAPDAPAALDNGGTIRLVPNGVDTGPLEKAGFDPGRNDVRIIGAVLGLKAAHPDCDVVLVTNDTAMGLIAKTVGVEVEKFAIAAPLESSGMGWRELKSPSEDVDLAHRLGYLDPDYLEEAGLLQPNEGVLLSSSDKSKHSVLLRKTTSPDHGGQILLKVPERNIELSDKGMIRRYKPRNVEQKFALDLCLDEAVSVVALAGPAGTGKTMLALAAGLHGLYLGQYDHVGIYRPVTPVGSNTDLGFLPGSLEEKLAPWFTAAMDNFGALVGDKLDHLGVEMWVEELKAQGKLSFGSIAHIRGRSIRNAFIVVDEAQNLEPSVAKALLTRAGEGTKLVFTGDVTQRDTPFTSERNNALVALVDAFHGQDCFGHLIMTRGERSALASLAADLM